MQAKILNEVLNSDLIALQQVIDEERDHHSHHGLKDQKSAIDVLGTCGESPLHISIYRRDSHMLRIICDAGADVNRPNKNGNPPIHLTAIMGYLKGAIALYDSGSCDLFLKNSDGYTAYELACMPVTDNDILLTRLYCNWHGNEGDLEEERIPIQEGRKQCAEFINEKVKIDHRAKELTSVKVMIDTMTYKLKASSIINKVGYVNEKIFTQGLEYPSCLDDKPWSESDIQFFHDYLPAVGDVTKNVFYKDFAARTIRSGVDVAILEIEKKRENSNNEMKKLGKSPLPLLEKAMIESLNTSNRATYN